MIVEWVSAIYFFVLILYLPLLSYSDCQCILHLQSYLSSNSSTLHICRNINCCAIISRNVINILVSLHSDANPLYQWEDALVLRKVRNRLPPFPLQYQSYMCQSYM